MKRQRLQPPRNLAKKLLAIREALKLTPSELLARIGIQGQLTERDVTSFEQGKRPPLPVLLKYAQIAGVCVDTLIDDEVDLPKHLPGV